MIPLIKNMPPAKKKSIFDKSSGIALVLGGVAVWLLKADITLGTILISSGLVQMGIKDSFK